MRKVYSSLILLLILVFTGACNSGGQKKGGKEAAQKVPDLEEILTAGKIRVVTNYNSTNYFVYKGQPMGYQFELLQEFATFIGVKLEVTVNNDLQTNFEALQNGLIDIIASNLPVMRESEDYIAYTAPHSFSRQVLVQQAYSSDQKGSNNIQYNTLIRNQLDLAGKSIYVQKGSAYVQRLRNLANEIGDSIHIVEIPDYEVEQLVELVAAGEIPYTVCDENLAIVNLNFYPNLDVETPVSFPQKQAWAVNKNAPELLNAINNWMVSFTQTPRYQRIYQKYFLNKRSIHLVDAGFHSIKGGQVSVYDELIKEESQRFDMDWRLIASIIYQESRFIPDAESWAGALGLMQLMPETAERFGVQSITSPRDNIRGGMQLLQWLDERLALRVEDSNERLKFVLAAYNVGIGHVLDAMKLAEKYGMNPTIWNDNVDFFLLHKSDPKYYNDPVVEFGYCRGEEPYQYVREILERYDHYKNVMR
ncbi:transglycosylase SLT domain-containing protein [Xiashengella succiniciproducens]|jgi:membrane-bound lytic murein transglycosylase F|uniref:Transporter substrate-binding domain-containing protein n=1 Tax=Xiashengella succiniciproducens TaxID=2949635 RepID=A0A9J6ZRE9_9BACT|nr:transporter substrate-binding domain-containing protein [Alkaliflexus sp. Ai-910]MDI9538976.1 transporter substrate-binding domain-containing protein [Bacteroidota bacterium]URW80231.1 transporter substrate-binding domain-containing protein [Alkaliflexus sp. Ai-910]HHT99725.1 transporter substrate-binding domain-containing protein [Bacteroidales bacterium]